MGGLKLFCLPYAGGSATQFYTWKRALAPQIQIVPVELAGRGRRMSEPPCTKFEDMIEDVYKSVKDYLDGEPYAVFGHSMGGLLAFELVKKLQKEGSQLPKRLILSGTKIPDSQDEGGQYSSLSDQGFLQKVKELGGISEEFLESEELVNLFLPVLRADFNVVESYKPTLKNEKLLCEASVFYGVEDSYTYGINKSKWQELFIHSIDFCAFQGTHFFINTEKDNVIKQLGKVLI